jgi:hypothetical protein
VGLGVGQPAGQLLSQFGPKLRGHMTTREGKGYGGGESRWRLASHMARPTDLHLVTYHLGQVGGVSPWPYKYPPAGENRHTQHILEIPLAKLPFLV